VPRLFASVVPDAAAPPAGAGIWGDTSVSLGHAGIATRRFRDIFTGAVVETETIDGTPALRVG